MSYSNEEILAGIESRDERVIRYIYETCFEDIKKLVVKNSGSEGDAQDIYQEALLIIYQKRIDSGLKLRHEFRAYIYSICRFLWLNEYRRRQLSLEESEFEQDNHAGSLLPKERLEKAKLRIYEKHYKELGEDCRKILDMYFKSVSMAEICRVMGYKNVQIAKDKKFRCKKRLMEKIYNNPEYKKLQDEIHLVS